MYRIHIHANNAFKMYQNQKNVLSLYWICNEGWNALTAYNNLRNVLSLYQLRIHAIHPCHHCLKHSRKKQTKKKTIQE